MSCHAKRFPDADLVRRVIDYEPLTGAFRWRQTVNRGVNAGDVAGTFLRGYRVIRINRVAYRACRLAWLLVYGKHPDGVIDHIDGNKSNDAIANLRDVTQGMNTENKSKASKNSHSGILGVTVRRTGSGPRYAARIGADGKLHWLGLYTTPEEAHRAYIDAKRTLHKGYTA
jgi:hypothetical protein